MVTLNLAIGVQLVFICDQCQEEMLLEGPSVNKRSTSLKCPKCGFRIMVNPEQRVQIPGASPGKFPVLRPKKF
jgi:DNA-directed RNA polymerase subunit RPC12/RpoP